MILKLVHLYVEKKEGVIERVDIRYKISDISVVVKCYASGSIEYG